MSNHTETTIKEAIDGFLLNCKVEGKSYGTIECYTDKLKGFYWYATNYDWPDDITEITTQHLREFLAYLRETPHRFSSTCPRAMKPINGTTIQKYYRALSALFNWSINEGIFSMCCLPTGSRVSTGYMYKLAHRLHFNPGTWVTLFL
ncbi:MAG: phage integrase N-terminal SAM-like domain-containing protein [Candidatus Atribacteria bacterium]|nr:phage integrase N-terminal SAM-like domain-containing protein [Candidatus Atribacteria bacterium]